MTDLSSTSSSRESRTTTFRVNSRVFASLLYAVGLGLLLFGMYSPVNWSLIGVGIVLLLVGFVTRSGIRLSSSRENLSFALDVEDRTLEIVGDEVRSAHGYTVRKIEDGIRYAEAGHSLILRRTAQDSETPAEGATFQETIAERTIGARTRSHTLTVKVSSKTPLRWDPPCEDEPIPRERLIEIMQRITQAVTYFESQGRGKFFT